MPKDADLILVQKIGAGKIRGLALWD